MTRKSVILITLCALLAGSAFIYLYDFQKRVEKGKAEIGESLRRLARDGTVAYALRDIQAGEIIKSSDFEERQFVGERPNGAVQATSSLEGVN